MSQVNHIFRSDEWLLQADGTTIRMAADTVACYQKLSNALASIFLTHWSDVHNLPVQELERFFHTTKLTPDTPYGHWFTKHFHKVPSYLRRAATMAAHGAVSSFMTRYHAWQGGDRRMRSQRPPQWGGIQTWPVLYAAKGGAGAMIHHNGDVLEIKLLDAATGDWTWRSACVVRRGKRHGATGAVPKSPMLILRGGSLTLAQPYKIKYVKYEPTPTDRVCAVDQGINKQAVCSIVDPNGTVIARKFISLAAHIDRRDKGLRTIQDKARQTIGRGGKLSKGFCRPLYQRAAGLNLHIARETSRRIIAFATAHGAKMIVFEDLKGFRPKGGRKRSNLRQKFHGWLHRLVVKQTTRTAEERGLGIDFVFPRGTSAWAYDGSGRVVRYRENYSLCRFQSGKEYNSDLSASYNIAARYHARRGGKARMTTSNAGRSQTTPVGGNANWPVRGGSSTAGPRAPATLSSLW